MALPSCYHSVVSNRLYTHLAEIGSLFYHFHFPHRDIAQQIDICLKRYRCQRIVFFGGFLDTVQLLQERGYDITYVEYTPEMMAQAKKVLRGMNFVLSDMRELNLSEPFDAIILMGRIFTYLHTDFDVQKTFSAFANNLRPGGIVMMDNYETGKIDADAYFNGTVEDRRGTEVVRRISTMEQIQDHPTLYRWDGVYEHVQGDQKESFRDADHILRAFSKDEIEQLLAKSPLAFVEHQPNFEEKSFVTLAQKR